MSNSLLDFNYQLLLVTYRMAQANEFTWVDYLVFICMLLIALSIGVVFGIVNRKKKSSQDFLLGGGDLHVAPVGFSILAGFISAIAILGFSGEMYRYGTMYYIIIISQVIVHYIVAFVYIPFYHQLNITSVYQVKYSSQYHALYFNSNISF